MGENPPPPPRCRFPLCIYGDQTPRGEGKSRGGALREPSGPGGPLWEGEGSRASGGHFARGTVHSGTLDLCWQEGNRGQAKPGEPQAALIPWWEEQAEPKAAGRSSSTGGQVKRILAADAPEGLCGGMGLAPAGIATSGEQHPGPSGMRWGLSARLADVDLGGEWQQKRAPGVQRGDLWCEEECVLDFEGRSIEEGELVNEGEEDGWWANSGGLRGVAGPLTLFLSHFRGLGMCNHVRLEGRWKGPRW
ncbi:hypothetical protein NDU88_004764 [Pleurodeles waltl]|uniref:Uncharacterized protein n=1 Tax=Pleurodeles waltl TaxID=8319 RepID=A0AAV7SJR0_PLEWA|nr:hypothetical protein NDU88_004764 [Pleurodeles waltl]